MTDNRPHLEIDHVRVRRGGIEILSDVSLRLVAGTVALRGPNGAGKSTLLRAIAGLTPIAAGSIRIAGFDLAARPALAKRNLAYVPDSTDLFPYLHADEFLALAARLRGQAPRDSEALFAELASTDLLPRRIGTLSAGQRRKLMIAAACAADPALLLLDEPLNTLDDASVWWLAAHVAQRSACGHVTVLAIHGPDDRLAFTSEWVIDGGRVQAATER